VVAGFFGIELGLDKRESTEMARSLAVIWGERILARISSRKQGIDDEKCS